MRRDLLTPDDLLQNDFRFYIVFREPKLPPHFELTPGCLRGRGAVAVGRPTDSVGDAVSEFSESRYSGVLSARGF